MTKKEAIESIKNATKAIGLLFYENEQKFQAVKVKDGTQDVSIEGEYAKGTKVSVSSATGSIPAPDNSYELSNGQSFSTKGGMIDEIMSNATDDSEEDFAKKAKIEADSEDEEMAKAPAAPVEGSPAEEASESPAEAASEGDEDADGDAAEDAANTAALKALADKINEMDTMISAIKDALAGKASKQEMSAVAENFKAIEKGFEVLANTPAEFSKVDNSFLAKEEKAKRLEALAGYMKK